MNKLTQFALILAGLVVAVGCESQPDGRPAVVPVSGTVMYRQQPVEGATILFSPQGVENGYGATGLTDAAGQFQLRSFRSGDGAVPGTYAVSIFKYDMTTANPEAEDDLAMENRKDFDQLVGPKPLLPVRYSSPDTSKMVEEVSANSTNDFDFDLVD